MRSEEHTSELQSPIDTSIDTLSYTTLFRSWTITPGIYYQNQQKNDIANYWPLYSDPSSGRFVNADPSRRATPDKFYLASLRIQGDLGPAQLISNTSYYHRREQTGYEGTLYNLGFYQTFMGSQILLDNSGVHLPAGATDYRSPATVDNRSEERRVGKECQSTC